MNKPKGIWFGSQYFWISGWEKTIFFSQNDQDITVNADEAVKLGNWLLAASKYLDHAKSEKETD